MPTPPGRIVGGSIVIDGTDIVPLSENELRRSVRWQTISMVFQGAMNCLTPVFTVGKQMMETLQQHKEMAGPGGDTPVPRPGGPAAERSRRRHPDASAA